MNSQTVTIPSGTLDLAGTLTRPPGQEPAAGVLLIAGSGPIDRDSNMKRLQLGITRQVAEGLTGHGFAALRFDKRGVGASDGDYRSAGFHENVADATAALRFLRQQPGVDPDKVYVVGHSEGALIAARLTATGAPTAGVVLIAGATQPGEDVLRFQARQLPKHLPKAARFVMKLFRIDIARSQAKRLTKIKESAADVIRVQGIVKLNAKWFREFMAFDPAPEFRNIQVPILAITGSDDIQVDPADIETMRMLTQAPFEGHVVPGVNHILRTGGPSPSTYKKQTRLPLDARVVDLLTDWLLRQATGVPDETTKERIEP